MLAIHSNNPETGPSLEDCYLLGEACGARIIVEHAGEVG